MSIADQQRHVLVAEPDNQRLPTVSPRGDWIAYGSDHTGQNEIYAISYPEMSQIVQVSTEGGTQARWRGDGSELFYRAVTGVLMSVELEALGFRTPEPLFEIPGPRNYAVAADGQRFLVATQIEDDTSAQINVVFNWFEELTQRVPTGGR